MTRNTLTRQNSWPRWRWIFPTFLEEQDLGRLGFTTLMRGQLIAFHSPCTLQHGLKRAGSVEAMLVRLGFRLADVQDAHLCCGSAGSYSILQRDLSQQLRKAKLEHLESEISRRSLQRQISAA